MTDSPTPERQMPLSEQDLADGEQYATDHDPGPGEDYAGDPVPDPWDEPENVYDAGDGDLA